MIGAAIFFCIFIYAVGDGDRRWSGCYMVSASERFNKPRLVFKMNPKVYRTFEVRTLGCGQSRKSIRIRFTGTRGLGSAGGVGGRRYSQCGAQGGDIRREDACAAYQCRTQPESKVKSHQPACAGAHCRLQTAGSGRRVQEGHARKAPNVMLPFFSGSDTLKIQTAGGMNAHKRART